MRDFENIMSPRKEAKSGEHSQLIDSDSKMIDYEPKEFLRCHSRKHIDVDRQTQVWKCAFKPDRTNTFATCGGNSVVVINAEDGSVLTKHYAKDPDEDFTALAWTTVTTANESFSLLAIAGRKFILHLLQTDEKVCIAEHSLKELSNGKKQSSNRTSNSFRGILCVESLMFHPEQPNILFGVFTDGSVHVWDIGEPHPPAYISSLKQLLKLQTGCSANAVAYSTHNSMLLCATEEGAKGWLFPDSSLNKEQNLVDFHFVFPSTKKTLAEEEKYFVDSIEVLRDGKLIATKCAVHGCIYIWDLKKAIQSAGKSYSSVKNKKTKEIIVTPLHTLNWSTTDDYFMIIGISQSGNILACGDNEGGVWVYDLDEIFASSSREHGCSKRLLWPVVEDERARKKKMLVYYEESDIFVNQVSLNYDASFLIAVTSINTVCIWKRVNRN